MKNRRTNHEDSKTLRDGVFRILLFSDGPRLFGVDQKVQSIDHDSLMKIAGARLPERMSQFEASRIECTRRARLPALFGIHSYENRRDPFHFDSALQRDDRPMAEWSAGGQEYGIRFPFSRGQSYLVGHLLLYFPHRL
jgi:hypothetical protein